MLLLMKRNKIVTAAAAIVAVLCVAFAINVFISQQHLKATFTRLKSTAPTFQAQALALIEESPNRPEALDEALENIEHAVELAPENAEFWTTKGHILQTLQRLGEARTAFMQALHRNQGQRSARENVGLCDTLLHDRTGSELSSVALGTLQKALQQQGRVAESLALLRRGGANDKTRIADAWQAVLKKAGIDRRPTVFGDGLLGLNLGTLPLDNLSALRGMPIADLTVPEQSGVSDLTPLAGMPLRRLWCVKNNVSDLSPLSGMPLKELFIFNSQVTDLSPLRGMPLETLHLNGLVEDLSVLRELPLKALNISSSRIRDLKGLEGLKLTRLVASTTPITDLSPLKGMPLEELEINNCPGVRDLSPLAGMPLKKLAISQCLRITDLGPLRGMPLEDLDLGQTALTDLRPLAGAPIRMLSLDQTSFTDIDQLKAFPKLEYVNLDRTTIADLTPLAGSRIQSLDLRNARQLKNVDQLAALPTLKAVALPLHIRDVGALRNKPGLVWVGYGGAPRPRDIASRKQDGVEFWKMNALEQQIRAADPQGRLHTGKFPYMERRFQIAKQFGRHWYRSYNIGMPWTEASRFAEELGGHLATINSAEEEEFIRKSLINVAGGRVAWIGARSDKPGGPWRWVTGEPWKFERWGRNLNGPMEPDGGRKPGSQPDLFVGYMNHGRYSNNPAWDDLPDNTPMAESMIIEWDE